MHIVQGFQIGRLDQCRWVDWMHLLDHGLGGPGAGSVSSGWTVSPSSS